jgi:hypothetical protein
MDYIYLIYRTNLANPQSLFISFERMRLLSISKVKNFSAQSKPSDFNRFSNQKQIWYCPSNELNRAF